MLEQPTDGGGTLYRYRFGDVTWDQGSGSLLRGGEPVPVEPRPLALLDALLQQPGVVLTKAELLATLWGRDESAIADNALANAVSKLRRALGPQGEAWVRNVQGIGYRLDARVERTVLRSRGALAAVLVAGQPVPGRDSFILDSPLGTAPASEVWLARQPRTHEVRVFKFCSDAERLAALKREFMLYRVLREALGPRGDFARVIDSNFATSPYWLECEYGGEAWPAWCARVGGEAGDTPARLALFLQVARAVAAAHAVGVLHKDLKPANVLVAPSAAGGWQLRLTDFGSGRVLDADNLARWNVTEMGLTVTQGVASDSGSGTPFYLAPELLAGQAPTVRSDLYALGLMLYQWLVGDFRRPMAPGWEADVPDPLLREDIAAATQTRPEARLASVDEWLARLERLEARRADRVRQTEAAAAAEAVAAQLARQRARRPWVWGLVATLALGLGTSLWFHQQSRLALAEAREQAARADAINTFLNQDLLQSADLSRVNQGKTLTVQGLLQRASAKAGQRFAGQPEVEASVRQQLAQIFLNTAALPQAQAEYERSIVLLEPRRPPGDGQLLALRFHFARLLVVRSQFEAASRLLLQADAAAGPETLAGQGELAYLSARTHFALKSLRHEGAAAATHGERALALLDALRPDDLAARAVMRRELADHYHRQSEPAKARALLEAALAPPFDAEALGEVGQARMRIQLARVLAAEGRLDQAVQNYRQPRERIVELLGPDEFTVAAASSGLATVYMEMGRFDEALAEARQAHSSLLRTVGVGHQHTRLAAANLALVELQAGHAAAALKALDDVRGWAVATFGGVQAALVQAIDYHRAQALNDLGRPADALPLLQPLDSGALAQLTPARDWPARLAAQHGRSLSLLGRHAEALALLDPALSQMQDARTAAWVVRPFREAWARSRGEPPPR
ncbi:MAG: protein kinase domain-containing protein [Pseudomonadota bacterium]